MAPHCTRRQSSTAVMGQDMDGLGIVLSPPMIDTGVCSLSSSFICSLTFISISPLFLLSFSCSSNELMVFLL